MYRVDGYVFILQHLCIIFAFKICYYNFFLANKQTNKKSAIWTI